MSAQLYDKESHASQDGEESSATHGAEESGAMRRSDEAPVQADEVTGASPGTAQACEDLGLNSLAANLERLGIKPPGQS